MSWNILYGAQWEQGAIGYSPGWTYGQCKQSNATRIRLVNLLPVEQGKTLTVHTNAGYLHVLQAFHADGTMTTVPASINPWYGDDQTFTVEWPYIAVAIRRENNGNITPSDLSGAGVVLSEAQPDFDKKLFLSGLAVGRQLKGWGTVTQERLKKHPILSQTDLAGVYAGTASLSTYATWYLGSYASAPTVSSRGDLALSISPRDLKNVQLKFAIPPSATRVGVRIYGAYTSYWGNYYKASLIFSTESGLTSQWPDGVKGTVKKQVTLIDGDSTAAAINAQSGVTIHVSSHLEIPEQTVEIDTSGFGAQTYLTVNACDTDVSVYEIWYEN